MENPDEITEQQKDFPKGSYSAAKVSIILIIALIFSLFFSSATLYTWTSRMEAGKIRNFFMTLITPIHNFNKSMNFHLPQQYIKHNFRALAGIKTEAGWEEAGQPEGTPGPTPALRPTPTAKPEIRYTRQNPLNVLLIGDSMVAENLSAMFGKKTASDDTIVYEKKAHYSSGLSRPDFYNWPAQVNAIYQEKNYDLVVVMLGMNDAQNITNENEVYAYGSDKWFTLYKKRFRNFIVQILGGSKRVYWLGPPIMRLSRYNRRMQQLNSIYREVCANIENATYIPTDSILSGGEMKYTDYLTVDNKLIKIRTGDGIHFTLQGAALVVDKILEKINTNYRFDYTTPLPAITGSITANN